MVDIQFSYEQLNLLLNVADEDLFQPGLKKPHKNRYFVRRDMCFFKVLCRGEDKLAVIDASDIDILKNYVFHGSRDTASHHIYLNTIDEILGSTKIHRLLTNTHEKKRCVDHLNHCGLDNRMCNLRPCTTRENARNRTRNKNNTSGYSGVSFIKSKKSWCATIHDDEGRRLCVNFYINQYGDDAKQKAIEQRREWELQFNYIN